MIAKTTGDVLRRTTGGIAALFTLLLLAPLEGCVGSIDDPERFGDGSYCPSDIDVPRLFRQRCGSSICHGASNDPAGGLDLESPGIAERLISVPAQECQGLLRVDPQDFDASFLFEKLEGPRPGCGDPMPFVGRLSQNEITCVKRYVEALLVERGDGGSVTP